MKKFQDYMTEMFGWNQTKSSEIEALKQPFKQLQTAINTDNLELAAQTIETMYSYIQKFRHNASGSAPIKH